MLSVAPLYVFILKRQPCFVNHFIAYLNRRNQGIPDLHHGTGISGFDSYTIILAEGIRNALVNIEDSHMT